MTQSLPTSVFQESFRQPRIKISDNLEELFQRVTEDDYAAFERIFKIMYKSLCTFAHRLVKNRESAEEIVDDVFCNLWKNRKKIFITASFKSYLLASVRNKSLDCLRKLRHEKNTMLENASEVICKQSIASESLVFEELNHRIEVAIQNLPRQCRTIFLMSRDQELKYREIAEILNISVKTVDTQMGRALKALRKTLSASFQ